MPFGFKLETEENIVKSMDIVKIQKNKQKPPSRQGEILKKQIKSENSDLLSNENYSFNSYNNKKYMRDRKPTKQEDLGYCEKVSKPKSLTAKLVAKKCEKGLIKIKNNPNADFFYINKTPNGPSLSLIERNIKNYKYDDKEEFLSDLRKLWSYYFQNYNKDPEIYKKTFAMSEYCEEVYKELEEIGDSKNNFNELNKKVDSLEKNFKSYRETHSKEAINPKKIDRSSNMDKGMTFEEKNELGKNIRNLSKEDLKGVVKIMRETSTIDNQQKYFEFDLDKIHPRKLRELEKFVNNCILNQKLKNEEAHHKATHNKPQDPANINKSSGKIAGGVNTSANNNNNQNNVQTSNNDDLDSMSSSDSDSNSLSSFEK